MFTPQILTNVINHKLNYINLNQQSTAVNVMQVGLLAFDQAKS